MSSLEFSSSVSRSRQTRSIKEVLLFVKTTMLMLVLDLAATVVTTVLIIFNELLFLVFTPIKLRELSPPEMWIQFNLSEMFVIPVIFYVLAWLWYRGFVRIPIAQDTWSSAPDQLLTYITEYLQIVGSLEMRPTIFFKKDRRPAALATRFAQRVATKKGRDWRLVYLKQFMCNAAVILYPFALKFLAHLTSPMIHGEYPSATVVLGPGYPLWLQTTASMMLLGVFGAWMTFFLYNIMDLARSLAIESCVAQLVALVKQDIALASARHGEKAGMITLDIWLDKILEAGSEQDQGGIVPETTLENVMNKKISEDDLEKGLEKSGTV